jgi:hypothetical protein
MTPSLKGVRAWVAPLVLAPALLSTGCDAISPNSNNEEIGLSAAYDIWRPGPDDTCTPEIHNQYSVVASDGLRYPTWHPATDPATGCTFGHEHGRDPSGSDLFGDVGPIPFGFANEQLSIYDPNGVRNEDHYGHKIEWENDFEMRLGGDLAGELFRIECDVLTKLHQGTHSKDAFTNNLHELAYHVRCSDGAAFSITLMSAIGTPGEFVSSCDGDNHIFVGPPVPANSPSGGGRRIIPDRSCIDQLFESGDDRSNFGLIRESWQVSQTIRTEDGRSLAHMNAYYQVIEPSRFYDATLPEFTGRPIDDCYVVGPTGERINGGPCAESTAEGTILDILYSDTRSAFDGADRFVDINSNDVDNAQGPEIWYTDPFGKNARTEPFPGSIRQYIAAMSNDRGLGTSGPNIGRDRDYGGSGVHSPN